MKILTKLFIYFVFIICPGCFNSPVPTNPPIEQPVNTDNTTEINKAIYDLTHPQQPQIINTPQKIGRQEIEIIDGQRCTVQRFEWAPGHSESILLDPQSDVIWPGSVLRGNGITDGSYAKIAGKRKNLTISTSKENIGKVSTSIEDPKLSTVRQGISELLAQEITGDINANMTFSQTEIHSKEHLKLAIEGNYDGVVTDITAKFNFNDNRQKSRYIVKFMQIYYTLDVDIPSSPSDWYSDVPRGMEEFTPVYISSVKYGRMAMLIFESTAESTELEAAIKASFNGAVASGSLNIDAEYNETWNQTKFDGIVVGGDSESGGNLIDGIDSFNNWVKKGTKYTANSAAAPLSYTLRFLDDNSIAKIILSGEYYVRDCNKVFNCELRAEVSNDGNCREGWVYAGPWAVEKHWGVCVTAGREGCELEAYKIRESKDCTSGYVYVGPNAVKEHGGYCITIHNENYKLESELTKTKNCSLDGVYVGPNKVSEHWGSCLRLLNN